MSLGRGCIVLDQWEKIIGRNDLDGLIIATPPSTHAKIAIKAIENNIPLIIEKPITTNINDAIKIYNLALKNQVPILVDHIHLFNPAFRKLKNIVDDTSDILRINTIAGNFGPFRKDVSVLWDWGPHDIAMCIHIIGKPPNDIKILKIQKENVGLGVGEKLSFELSFDNNIKANIVIGNTFKEKKRIFKVFFENKQIVFDDCNKPNLYLVNGQFKNNISNTQFDSNNLDPLDILLLEFIDLVKKNIFDKHSLALAVDVVKTLSLAQEKIDASSGLLYN